MKYKVSNKSWILISTAMIIGIVFSLYFLVYVKGKEKAIISNNFRVLQQVVQNIKSLETSYLKNAEISSKSSIKSSEVNQNLDTINAHQKTEIHNLFNSINAEIVYGKEGIFFKVKSNSGAFKYYFTDYDAFFNNELFQRKDVFDQIIITKVKKETGGSNSRNVLYSNHLLGIMDSSFYAKTLQSAKDEITINDSKFVSYNQTIDDESNIYISGLVSKAKFEQQKRSISPLLIFTLSISLILIIMAMPLLKLKIMSNEERLYIKDVVFTVISVLIGPAVLLVFLYTLLIFFGKEKTNFENNLIRLSNKIELNFQKELQRLVYQIDDINKKFPLVSKNSSIVGDTTFVLSYTNLSNLFEERLQDSINTHKVKGYKVFEDVVLKDEIDFKHLKAAFWTDSSYRIAALLSAFHNPSYAQDLKHRKYLTNILDHKPDYFKDSFGIIHEIAIESIKSVSDGSYEVGVGKSTSTSAVTLPVMAISTKLASVMGLILEEGYGFCILDKDGNTMFHSDIRKNMNENFISETNDIFKHSMVSKTHLFKHSDYEGKSQTIYFRPIDCLSDHYIATFVNSEVQFAPYTTSMISSFILFLCYLLLVLLVYLIMYFAAWRSTKLKQTIYVFNFLRPYETKPHFIKYKRLILFSILVIIYLILSSIMNKSHYDFLIMDMIIVTNSLLIFSFYTLFFYQSVQKVRLSIFKKRITIGFKLLAIGIIFLLVYRTIHFIDEKHGYQIILNSIAGLLLVVFIIFESLLAKKGFEFDFLNRWKFSIDQVQASYKLYLFLWGIILSIIPINLIFRITYEKEISISAKYRSLDVLNKINDWEKINAIEFSEKFEDIKVYDSLFVQSMKQDTIHWAIIESRIRFDPLPDSNKIHDDFMHNPYFNKIYKYIRPDYNKRTSITSNFNVDQASNLAWAVSETDDSIKFSLKPDFNQKFQMNQVEKRKGNFFSERWFYVLVILGFSLIILMKFLSFTLDKIYGFRYRKYAGRSDYMNSDLFIENFINPKIFSNNSSYNNIFIVCINSSNTFPIKHKLTDAFNDEFLTLDFYDFQVKTSVNIFSGLKSERLKKDWGKIEEYFDQPEKKIYILIEHFEFGYNDVAMNKLKLEALKYLVDCEHFKVLISSEISATKLLDYYEDSVNEIHSLLKTPGIGDRIALQRKMEDLKIDFKKWQHLLGSFVTCIIPIRKFPYNHNLEYEKELAHGEYLNMIKKYMGSRMKLATPKDDMVLTIQQMSSQYYFSIWNSLSKDERYIVYDIANDMFVNTINTDGILSLLNKGILVYDHSLRLMNESFVNFVLTKVNSDEALEMEMESRKKGSWHTAFGVILLLIISLVIFLSIGQQNFLNDLNSFLTAIAALIGLLLRFSGFLSFGGRGS